MQIKIIFLLFLLINSYAQAESWHYERNDWHCKGMSTINKELSSYNDEAAWRQNSYNCIISHVFDIDKNRYLIYFHIPECDYSISQQNFQLKLFKFIPDIIENELNIENLSKKASELDDSNIYIKLDNYPENFNLAKINSNFYTKKLFMQFLEKSKIFSLNFLDNKIDIKIQQMNNIRKTLCGIVINEEDKVK